MYTLPSNPELLKALLMDYASRKRYRRPHPEAARVETATLAGCGDRITLYLSMDDSGRLLLTYEARGCLISQSSAAMMAEMLQERSLEDARKAVEQALDAILHQEWEPLTDTPLHYLKRAVRLPSRARCAALPWQTVRTCLETLTDDT